MNKLIRDGKVAVIISPDFGGGWSTWNDGIPELLFDPRIVALIERGEAITQERLEEFGYTQYVFIPSRHDFEIVWLPVNTRFMIHEYDGSERVRILEEMQWITA